VVHVQIEESPIKPVWAFGKPYKRVGRTNQSISREETLRLVDQTTGRTWDALPCIGLAEEALDRQTVVDYLKRAGQSADLSTTDVLENLRLRLPDGSKPIGRTMSRLSSIYRE
jgi:predicted HTH transcriptional regulator